MLKKYVRFALCAILGLFFSSLVFSQQEISIVQGPFNISWCENGNFYFEETSDLDYPINFVLQCRNSKIIVDKYYIDGANIVYSSNGEKVDMSIESVFFQKIQSKSNLFVIVKRVSTHKAERINTNDYDIYVYEYKPQKIISLNKKMMKDMNLSGSEGEIGGEYIYFKYKTAAEVKKYINQTYNLK